MSITAIKALARDALIYKNLLEKPGNCIGARCWQILEPPVLVRWAMAAQGSSAVRSEDRFQGSERRRWDRLPLAIPVFVCGTDERGKQFREFTTALNIGAGGALLATRRYLPVSSRISLEIPTAPLPRVGVGADFVRSLPARLVTVTHSEQCYLCGLKFARPLVDSAKGKHGKKYSSVV